MLQAVVKVIGGVEEVRYHGGRGGIPFRPVDPIEQRRAARFLLDQAFATPTNLLDPQVVGRIAPSSADDTLQGSNIRLLQQLLTPGVFSRMAEASAGRRGEQSYYGLDMLEDFNDRLFRELSQDVPVIDMYRRQLQRNYVLVMLLTNGAVPDPEADDRGFAADTAALPAHPGWDAQGASERREEQRAAFYAKSPLADAGMQYRAAVGVPSEMRGAIHWALDNLVERIEAALPRVRDPETWAHLRDLRAEIRRRS